MNVYLTEEEQVEQIKNWLKKYGYSIVTGIVLGLAIMYGWQYWNDYKIKTAQHASVIYDDALASYSAEQSAEVKAQSEELISEYKNTPYATMANLLLAKQAVDDNDLNAAKDSLMWVVDNSKTSAFRQIARIRAAKVMVAQNETEQALALLDKVDDEAFSSLINETKGDIYVSLGKSKQAREAYQLAISSDPSMATLRPVLSIKLNSIDVSKGDKA